MRVLVTGGAGFIGSHVSAAFLERGDAVTVLDDLSTGSADRLPAGSDLVVGDITDPATVATIAALRPDLVVHAAAQVSVARSVAEPDHDSAINVQGTKHVLDGARAGGARRIVFLSSGGAVYGEADGADESAQVAPLSPYGRNKRRAELAIESSGLDHAIARLSNVYGPGQRADLEGGVVAIFVDALRAGRPIAIHGSGSQVRDFLHVADAADAIVRLGDASRNGTWNVATGQATSIRVLLGLLEDLLGPAVAVVAEPARAGDVAHSVLAIGRIERELGWRPRFDIATGLAALVDDRIGAPDA